MAKVDWPGVGIKLLGVYLILAGLFELCRSGIQLLDLLSPGALIPSVLALMAFALLRAAAELLAGLVLVRLRRPGGTHTGQPEGSPGQVGQGGGRHPD